MDLEKLVGLTLHGKSEQETQIFEECFRLVGSQKTEKEHDIGFCLLARMVEKASPNTLRSFQSRLANRFAQISDKFTLAGCLFVREVLVKNPKSGDLHSTTVSKIINQCIDVGVQTEDPTIRALASDLFGLRANSNQHIAQLINTIAALQNPQKTSNSSDILELSTFGISSLKVSLQNLLFECLAWSLGQIQISGISIDRKNMISCIENGIKMKETRHVAFVCLRSLCANAKWSILPMIPRIVSSLISDLDNIDSDLIETLAFISQIFGPINSTLYKHFYVLFSAIKQPLHLQKFAVPAANLFANIIEHSAAFVKPEIFISVQKLICELAIRFVDVDLYQMILAAFMALGNEYVPSPLQFGEPGNDDFTVELSIKFTDPEGIPETTIDGIDEKFEVTRIFEAIEKMKAVAEENLCMVMVFAIVSAMQEEIEELLNGNVVTPKSLRAWKEKLDAERKAANESAEKERLAALDGRLTDGKTIVLEGCHFEFVGYDVDTGAQDKVEIDESLFDKEMRTQSPPFSTGPCNILIAQVVCSRTKSHSEITQNLRKMCQIAARPRVTDIANIKAKKTISLKEAAVIQEEIVEKAENMEISENPKELEEADNLSENEEEEDDEEEIQIIEPEPKKEAENKRKSAETPEKVEVQPKKKQKVVVKEVNLLAGEQSVDDILNFFRSLIIFG
ncbi:unnamed protein product [Caenorhabditis angaria]|uniref:Uncharacterized protein n=1 Tax=Caenorhabditis angaria TaxID=860376 RepID=A0A9P1I720_9PELO|nr:unnamed protein product [Caenorhabditis angaria]